jgi:hypothetical protein
VDYSAILNSIKGLPIELAEDNIAVTV